MRCAEARESIWLDASGELDPPHRSELERHLAGCTTCRAARSESLPLERAVGERFAATEVPEGLEARILSAIDREGPVAVPSSRRRALPLAMAAALLLAALAAWWFRGRSESDAPQPIARPESTPEPPAATFASRLEAAETLVRDGEAAQALVELESIESAAPDDLLGRVFLARAEAFSDLGREEELAALLEVIAGRTAAFDEDQRRRYEALREALPPPRHEAAGG